MKIQQISRSLKSKRCYSTSNKNPRILMTGSLGQIGTELSALLRKQYGSNNVIVTDVKKAPEHIIEQGPYRYLDVTDKKSISKMVVDERIDWVLHLSSILSATGERNMELAMKINIDGIQNVLEVAKDHQLRVYAPSSIAAFGGGTPLENTPDIVPMRPGTIYGVSKVLGIIKYTLLTTFGRCILNSLVNTITRSLELILDLCVILVLFHLKLFQEEEPQITLSIFTSKLFKKRSTLATFKRTVLCQ
eukprot:TRINITY_DN5799_c0_g1_i2.p1 TRINITY_DN5799_c0_g1~~TRINITY_DN5799_c0_g1_i2.p1  ORF type:complete len:247 (-),score=35.73 TRINITY_DN5799_c0_g1_i2:363-1103(-)